MDGDKQQGFISGSNPVLALFLSFFGGMRLCAFCISFWERALEDILCGPSLKGLEVEVEDSFHSLRVVVADVNCLAFDYDAEMAFLLVHNESQEGRNS